MGQEALQDAEVYSRLALQAMSAIHVSVKKLFTMSSEASLTPHDGDSWHSAKFPTT